MNPLEADIKRLIKGDVFSDDLTRHIYSFGASIYKIKPKCVVMPRDKDDIAALVKYAADKIIALTPRGACTSLAGQALGSGIIVDFTKYMNRVISYDGGGFVDIEPGVVYSDLNKKLEKFGKFFPPDPSSGNYCTVGGMIANNSGGPHSAKYGNAAYWCEELEVILPDGAPIRFKSGVSIGAISESLKEVFKRNSKNIEDWTPKVKRLASGYNVYGAVKDDSFDPVKLIAGSEGTLAMITECRLRLADIPKNRGVLLIALNEGRALADIVYELRQFEPAAVEFMDGTFIKLALEMNPRLKEILPPSKSGILLVEFEEEAIGDFELKCQSLKRRLLSERTLAEAINSATEIADRERLWAVRRAAVPITNRIKGKRRPAPFIEDAIVPPEQLDKFIKGAYDIFERYLVEACVYGHAGDGNMHIRPLLDMKNKSDLSKMNGISDDFYGLVISLGGCISAEHGDGILRTPYLKKQFGPLYAMFKEIKDIFDPKGIFNPGKKMSSEETIVHDLICDPETKYAETKTVFDSEFLRKEVEKCHSCGLCRNICPVNLNLPEEAASPRAKAALLKIIITGQLDRKVLLERSIKDIFDLCVDCRSCKVECPTGADISFLCRLLKENYINARGFAFSDSLVEDIYFLGRMISKLPNFMNFFSDSHFGRFVIEFLTGIDKRRRLPKPSLPIYEKRRLVQDRGRRKAAYFYGCYVNFFGADSEGLAVAKIFKKNAIELMLPPQKCCGIPSISSGNIEDAKKDMNYNLRHLYEAVSAGFDIVTSCPSCGLAIKEDYPRVLNAAQAVAVSERIFDIHEYLWLLFNEGALSTDFKSFAKNLVFHSPCHLKAQNISGLQESLVKLIPGISIKQIDDSCCGMAGAFGLKRRNYELSMSMGKRLFDNIREAEADIIVTSCGACKSQISQAVPGKVVHPVELLAGQY